MFGIANQLLAALALALVTTWLVNRGRGRYAFVTIIPMLFVTSTTLTAGQQMIMGPFSTLNTVLTIFVIACVLSLMLWSIARWIAVWMGKPVKLQ
jgi:carbon starvation protein